LQTPGGAYSSFPGAAVINNQGNVVFWATLTAGGSGLITGPDADLDKVIATGDSLFGSTVTTVVSRADRALNNAGQEAFQATLADGRTVIARADPVPGGAGGAKAGNGFGGRLYVVSATAFFHGGHAQPQPGPWRQRQWRRQWWRGAGSGM
jgi:hypothetical protein